MASFQSRIVAHRRATIAQYAAANRCCATWSEQVLWAAIRGRALGVTFRRQVPVGHGFIADFYASEARLIVEVDGSVHVLKAASDRRRDAKLTRLGYFVLWVPSEVVERDVTAALRLIREALVRVRRQ